MHERFAMRGHVGPRGYSEEGYGAEVSGGASSGRNYGYQDRYAGEGSGPEYGEAGPPPGYGEEGPDYGPEDDGYAAGYSGGAAMSINAPAALDSWHGYGVECPPY